MATRRRDLLSQNLRPGSESTAAGAVKVSGAGPSQARATFKIFDLTQKMMPSVKKEAHLMLVLVALMATNLDTTMTRLISFLLVPN